MRTAHAGHIIEIANARLLPVVLAVLLVVLGADSARAIAIESPHDAGPSVSGHHCGCASCRGEGRCCCARRQAKASRNPAASSPSRTVDQAPCVDSAPCGDPAYPTGAAREVRPTALAVVYVLPPGVVPSGWIKEADALLTAPHIAARIEEPPEAAQSHSL